MNATTRNTLIKKLTPIIARFVSDSNLNETKATDIGWIGPKTYEYMARAAITILEANSDAQMSADESD